MGKSLDMLLGRPWRQTSKLKSLLGLTSSRLSVLRNQRHVRAAQARGDVAHLLQLNHTDRALLRVEQVIKEQNMSDVFLLIDGYCRLLINRATLLQNKKECPEELREAVASLAFAASRCGDLPELQDVRRIFAAKFGKEFVTAAVELRDNCAVNTQMIERLSTKQESLETRIRVAKEIATERGIPIPVSLQHPTSDIPSMEANAELKVSKKQSDMLFEEIAMEAGHKYMDVVSAAQAAFKSAAYAAMAARAAVELSQAKSQGKGSGDLDNNTYNVVHGKDFDKVEPVVHIYTTWEADDDDEVKQLPTRKGGNQKANLEKVSLSSSSSSSSRSASFDAELRTIEPPYFKTQASITSTPGRMGIGSPRGTSVRTRRG